MKAFELRNLPKGAVLEMELDIPGWWTSVEYCGAIITYPDRRCCKAWVKDNIGGRRFVSARRLRRARWENWKIYEEEDADI